MEYNGNVCVCVWNGLQMFWFLPTQSNMATVHYILVFLVFLSYCLFLNSFCLLECVQDNGWLQSGSLLLRAEKPKPWLQQLLRVQIFLVRVLTIYRWRSVTLCILLLRDQKWFIFVEQIFSDCLRTFSDVVCMQLLTGILYSGLLVFWYACDTLLHVWHEKEKEREKEVLWDVATVPIGGRKSQFPVKPRPYRVSLEQRHGVTFEGHHGIAFISVCKRIYFHTHHCVCYVCIKVQVIFPSNSPSGLSTLSWDDLFRLGY